MIKEKAEWNRESFYEIQESQFNDSRNVTVGQTVSIEAGECR